jgi:hypothetical protein
VIILDVADLQRDVVDADQAGLLAHEISLLSGTAGTESVIVAHPSARRRLAVRRAMKPRSLASSHAEARHYVCHASSTSA